MKVEFTIDEEAFQESDTKKLKNVYLTIEYENPQAYGYPEVAYWSKEYKFDMNEIRSKLNV